MREGIRRLAVAIRWLTWLYFVAVAGFGVWMLTTDNLPTGSSDRIGIVIFAILPTLLGLGLSWVLEGFSKPDREAKP